jgi:hypothetical protein
LLTALYDSTVQRDDPSAKFAFTAAVGEFAMQLRDSQYLPMRKTDALLKQVDLAMGLDAEGAVAEFRDMIEMAASL